MDLRCRSQTSPHQGNPEPRRSCLKAPGSGEASSFRPTRERDAGYPPLRVTFQNGCEVLKGPWITPVTNKLRIKESARKCRWTRGLRPRAQGRGLRGRAGEGMPRLDSCFLNSFSCSAGMPQRLRDF